MFLQVIKNRLPKSQSLLSVYAVIVFMVYTWTLYVFISSFPYWLRFLNISEILALLSYAMLTNLIESLSLFFLLAGLCVILPASALKTAFVVRGTVIVICLLVAILVFLNNNTPTNLAPSQLIMRSLAVILAVIIISFVAPKLRFVATVFTWLSENMTIFLYIYIPMTILASLVVLVRNL